MSTPWLLWTDTTFGLTEYRTSTILGQYEIRAQQACYGAGSQMEEENVEDFEIVGWRNETGNKDKKNLTGKQTTISTFFNKPQTI